jgi:hypothetical protein
LKNYSSSKSHISNHLSYGDRSVINAKTCFNGKTMGSDGFVDEWIRKVEKKHLLSDLWNKRTLNSMRDIFKVDLDPPNKVWPIIFQ